MNGDQLLRDLGKKMGVDQDEIDRVIEGGIQEEVEEAIHDRAEQLRNFETEDET